MPSDDVQLVLQTTILPNGSQIHTNILDVHLGNVAYQRKNKKVFNLEPHLAAKWQHNATPHSIDILAAPAINTCSCFIIKSLTTGMIYFAHIPEYYTTGKGSCDYYYVPTSKNYIKLLDPIETNEELQIIAFNTFSRPFVWEACKAKGVAAIRSYQHISLYPFFTSHATVWSNSSTPKDVYIYYIPANDRIIIYADEVYSTKQPGIFVADNVFKYSDRDCDSTVNFHAVKKNHQTEKLFKSPNAFKDYLYLFIGPSLERNIPFEWQDCPEPSIPQKKMDAYVKRIDFSSIRNEDNTEIDCHSEFLPHMLTPLARYNAYEQYNANPANEYKSINMDYDSSETNPRTQFDRRYGIVPYMPPLRPSQHIKIAPSIAATIPTLPKPPTPPTPPTPPKPRTLTTRHNPLYETANNELTPNSINDDAYLNRYW